MIYFDHAATSPLDPKVLEVMLPYLGEFYGNPSSLHSLGRKAKEGVELARMKVGLLFGKKMRSVIFTGSGTEADNLALATGVRWGQARGGSHIITSSIEHPAILRSLEEWEKRGIEVTYLRPNREGLISPSQVEEAIRPETFLISLMTVNNEIGTIQPVHRVQELARSRGVLFHTDAVQALATMGTQEFTDFDLLSLSAHKFNGPKGVGALIAREDLDLQPLIFGGGQERGIRSGTENVAAIVGLGEALERKQASLRGDRENMKKAKAHFLNILDRLEGVSLSTSQDQVAPNFIHLMVEGIDQDVLLFQLDKRGILASAGSACSAGATEKSHVLTSLGGDLSHRAPLRISLGPDHTEKDMEALFEALYDIRKTR